MVKKLGAPAACFALSLFVAGFFLIAPVSFAKAASQQQWGPWIVDRPATCTKEGLRHRVHDQYPLTPDIEYQSIPKTPHKYKETLAKPTCTKPGKKIFTCVACGHTYTKKGAPALGHDWGPWTMVKKPAVGREGLKERTCSRCGLKQERSVAALPPVPAPVKPVKPANKPGKINALDVAIPSANVAVLGVCGALILYDIPVIVWGRKKLKRDLGVRREGGVK